MFIIILMNENQNIEEPHKLDLFFLILNQINSYLKYMKTSDQIRYAFFSNIVKTSHL